MLLEFMTMDDLSIRRLSISYISRVSLDHRSVQSSTTVASATLEQSMTAVAVAVWVELS